jgi:hypothetical protein
MKGAFYYYCTLWTRYWVFSHVVKGNEVNTIHSSRLLPFHVLNFEMIFLLGFSCLKSLVQFSEWFYFGFVKFSVLESPLPK